jgi:L-fuconolactonase
MAKNCGPAAPLRIDSHQHFWHYDATRDSWITDEMSVLKRNFLPQDLFPHLEANAFDGCVTVQVDQSMQETMLLLDLARIHPEIKGVVGWVDLCADDLSKNLEHLSKFEKLRVSGTSCVRT